MSVREVSHMRKFIYFVLAVLSGLSFYVHADGTWVNCERTNGYYQYFDSTIVQVGKDASVGDALGTWVTSANPTAWTCSHRKNYEGVYVQMAVQGYPPYTVLGNTQVDGQTYTVYDTSVKAGLGYIARWRYTVKGQTSNWFALTEKSGVYQTPPQMFTPTYDSSEPNWHIGVDVQIRFIKTSTNLTAGSTVAFDPMYMRHYQAYDSKIYAGGSTYMIAEFRSGGLIISSSGGTCTTSDINLSLPTISRSDFTGVGFTTARTDFTLDLMQCPAGLASISYMFTPTTNILDNAEGLFSLNSSATASGVALQLLTENSIPVNFNKPYLLNDYDPSQSNANYKIPLRAGLYQTSNNVSPGSINGAVTFTLIYK